ncbi:MAG: lytic murein transglycosylase, partial [Pseudomonadota bacterium]
MKKMSVMLTLALLAGCVKPVGAAPAAAPVAHPAGSTLAETGRDPAEFPAYVEQLKRRAIKQGIPAATVEDAFANAHFVDRVINADRNQLEKKITLDDYLSRVLPAWKIQR